MSQLAVRNDQEKSALKVLKNLAAPLSHLGTNAFKVRQKEQISERLELIFFLQDWFAPDYNPRPADRAHKSSNRNEDRAGEEGVLINIRSIVEQIKRKEIDSAQSVIQRLWGLIDNAGDRNSVLVDKVKEALEKLNQSKLGKSSLQLCCAASRRIPSRPVACKSNNCTSLVSYGDTYYKHISSNQDSDSASAVTICHHCFKTENTVSRNAVEVKKRKLNVPRIEWKRKLLPKSEFRPIRLNHDDYEWEPTVECLFCGNIAHTNCVMFEAFNASWSFDKDFQKKYRCPFVCCNCKHHLAAEKLRQSNKLDRTVAKILEKSKHLMKEPQLFPLKVILETELSGFMQSNLQKFLFEYCGKNNERLPETPQVREVCFRRKVFEAQPKMKKEFIQNNLPYRWHYQYRSIFLFQQDPETKRYYAVFNLIAHEYPERGIVYISYIDSVKLFTPSHLRTKVFQHVVMLYLKYMQTNGGYERLHFWVCPPMNNDEYVFYGRPPDQNRQKHSNAKNYDGLTNWYKNLMELCKTEGVISKYEQIGGPNSTFQPYKTLLEVPYFMDDFWVSKLEEILENEVGTVESSSNSKTAISAKGKHQKELPMSIEKKLEHVINTECKGHLFVAYFTSAKPKKLEENRSEGSKKVDPEDIFCNYMSSRESLMIECRERKMDFSDHRRASFATTVMLTRIAEDALDMMCKTCKKSIRSGVYCVECDDEVFCDETCAKRSLAHRHLPTVASSSQPQYRNFTVPIKHELSQSVDKITRCLSKVIIGEGDCLEKIHKFCSRVSPFNNGINCLKVIDKMLATPFTPKAMSALHTSLAESSLESCELCDCIATSLNRHKKICRRVNCGIPACSKSNENHSQVARRDSSLQDPVRSQPPQLLMQQARPTTPPFYPIKNALDRSKSSRCRKMSAINCNGVSSEEPKNKLIRRVSGQNSEPPLVIRINGETNGHVIDIPRQFANSIKLEGSNGKRFPNNGFIPLSTYTKQDSALTSDTPFTQSLQRVNGFPFASTELSHQQPD